MGCGIITVTRVLSGSLGPAVTPLGQVTSAQAVNAQGFGAPCWPGAGDREEAFSGVFTLDRVMPGPEGAWSSVAPALPFCPFPRLGGHLPPRVTGLVPGLGRSLCFPVGIGFVPSQRPSPAQCGEAELCGLMRRGHSPYGASGVHAEIPFYRLELGSFARGKTGPATWS